MIKAHYTIQLMVSASTYSDFVKGLPAMSVAGSSGLCQKCKQDSISIKMLHFHFVSNKMRIEQNSESLVKKWLAVNLWGVSMECKSV